MGTGFSVAGLAFMRRPFFSDSVNMIPEPHLPPVLSETRPESDLVAPLQPVSPLAPRPVAPARIADRTNLPAFGLTWLFGALLPYVANLVGRHVSTSPILTISLAIVALGFLSGLWFVDSPQFGWRRMDDAALVGGLAGIVLVWFIVPTDWLMGHYARGLILLWAAPLLYDGLRRVTRG